jgi:hypothetical protein
MEANWILAGNASPMADVLLTEKAPFIQQIGGSSKDITGLSLTTALPNQKTFLVAQKSG